MEVKILRTINTICLIFSPFPPCPPAMLQFMHPCTLYPILKVFVYPSIGWRGEGRAIRFIHRLEKCINDATCAYLTGLEITACRRTMSGQKQVCLVESLDGRTFYPLFYTSNVIRTFTFLSTIGQDWTLLTFIKEKSGGWGREKGNQIKKFYNVSRS